MPAKRHVALAAPILSLLLFPALAARAQSGRFHVEVHNPVKFDRGEELGDKPGNTPPDNVHRPLKRLPVASISNNRKDPAIQYSAPLQLTADAGINFEGVASGGASPSDANLAVGPNHIVQWVNASFSVYDKAGARLAGYPKPGNVLWSGFGGPCEADNAGDPIAQYDALADRWVMSQFAAIDGPVSYQCFAVSTGPKPTGAYYRYAYTFSDGMNDYPKIGVWPSAYFATYNMFASGFLGSKLCAYDRASMLSGQAAKSACFQLDSSHGGVLPSDLDGGAAFQPPASAPGYFLEFANNSLNLWRFRPNWALPGASTLDGPINIHVGSFIPACGGGVCIPQLGTQQQLDSLGDRLMYRFAYRNFGDHESLVVNHSVAAGSTAGVRWYEIRGPSTTPFVFQQGTYAPDSSYRWMGSIAMDRLGNIGLGYSVSSASMHPAIRYTGREVGDPLGTLQAERSLIEGGGSQLLRLDRWGDYTALRIDPADDCTFWYTNQYHRTSGTYNWSTRIGSFKFASCGTVVVPDFSITILPVSQTVLAGNSVAYTVTITPLNGYAGTVNLSVTGLPAAASAVLTPASLSSGTSTLQVNTAASTPAASYSLTVNGTDSVNQSLAHSTKVTLLVTSEIATPPARRIGIFRSGTWMLDLNGNGVWDGSSTDRTVSLGVAGDIPVIGDWNGSGTSKVGIFRNGAWYLDYNGNGVWDGPAVDKVANFGITGDIPVVGDWNGTGYSKIGVFRNGYWYLDDGDLAWNAALDKVANFGSSGDIPVVGDWTGTGFTKIGIFRNGYWALDTGNLKWDPGIDLAGAFGTKGDIPKVGDWNGDGKTKVGLFRNGTWFLDNGNLAWESGIDQMGAFGTLGDVPVVGDWGGNGKTEVGVFRNGTWFLDNGNLHWDPGVDQMTAFGLKGDTPVVGAW